MVKPRLVLRLAASGSAGAVLTVGVAWGFALDPRIYMGSNFGRQVLKQPPMDAWIERVPEAGPLRLDADAT
jgi:hypothetical protein